MWSLENNNDECVIAKTILRHRNQRLPFLTLSDGLRLPSDICFMAKFNPDDNRWSALIQTKIKIRQRRIEVNICKLSVLSNCLKHTELIRRDVRFVYNVRVHVVRSVLLAPTSVLKVGRILRLPLQECNRTMLRRNWAWPMSHYEIDPEEFRPAIRVRERSMVADRRN